MEPISNQQASQIDGPAGDSDNLHNVIEIAHLKKAYGKVEAIKGLDLSVRKGEVYGFLGRNGAGKSTTIRIIMGITKPSEGNVLLFGKPLSRNYTELRQKIGYVAQEQHFYGWMTPESIGNFVRGFYPTWNDKEFYRLIKTFDLPESRKIRTLSGGMRAKLALALALAHSPEILLLDEPTAGLDAVARREFIEMVRDQAERSHQTIFFSSHLIDEVEAAAHRVGIIDNGTMYYQGSLSTLSESVRMLSHSPLDGGGIPPIPDNVFNAAHGLTILKDRIRHGKRQIVVRTNDPRIFDSIVPNNSTWTMGKMSLEEIFIEMVRKPIQFT